MLKSEYDLVEAKENEAAMAKKEARAAKRAKPSDLSDEDPSDEDPSDGEDGFGSDNSYGGAAGGRGLRGNDTAGFEGNSDGGSDAGE